MNNKLLLPRDETTSNHPAEDQIVVGELKLNSVTGTLYTKLTDGSIVEFKGQKVCYASVPKISFSDVSSFCCYGDTLTVNIVGLLPSPKSYSFSCEELTGNGNSAVVNAASYAPYTDPEKPSISLRQATVPVTISISNAQKINIFKFTIYSDNSLITEKTIAITCNVCGS